MSSRESATIELKGGPLVIVREGLTVYPSRMITPEEAQEIDAILKVWNPWDNCPQPANA